MNYTHQLYCNFQLKRNQEIISFLSQSFKFPIASTVVIGYMQLLSTWYWLVKLRSIVIAKYTSNFEQFLEKKHNRLYLIFTVTCWNDSIFSILGSKWHCSSFFFFLLFHVATRKLKIISNSQYISIRPVPWSTAWFLYPNKCSWNV